MDKSRQRLNLLFSNKESLLEKDTGLRLPVSGTEKELDVSTNEGFAITAITQALATTKVHGPVDGENKEDGSEVDECRAFESGIIPPLSLVAQSFCPAVAIARLPYKYMRRDETSQAIGKHFFDQGGFWKRDWDLYYLFSPPALGSRVLLLIPALQVQQFLDQIGKRYNIRLTLPMNPELGLLLSFQEKGIPQPRYLGRSSSKDTKDNLVAAIPPRPDNSVDCNILSQGDTGALNGIAKAFHEMMEAGLNATKTQSKASRQRKRAEKIERQQQWVQSLKRAQCYLGLHPSRGSDCSDDNETMNPATSTGLSIVLSVLPALRLDMVAPFSFAHDPIFISIDLEWNERRRNEVTEVGISTLDTLDITNVAPGDGGKNWIRWIRSRHIRIKENAHVVNQNFVSGCPDRFDFGQSEFVSLGDASQVVEGCFHPPYSAQFPVKFLDEGPSGEPRVTIETTIREYKLRPRNIILVGHGLQGDIDYLGVLGCNLFTDDSFVHPPQDFHRYPENNQRSQNVMPHFLDTLDTATMFQVLKREANPRSLETVLNCVDIVGWNLHNAGNDARYTLEAMIRIIINARLALDNEPREIAGNYMDWAIRPLGAQRKGRLETTADEKITSYEVAWKAEVERRVAEATADREEQIRDDCKIWEIITGWDSEIPLAADDIDGGNPKGMTSLRAKKQEK